MKTKYVIFSFLMLCVPLANAQDFLFKVMASKGGNKVESSQLTSGKKIYKNQKISVVNGGYVSLVHNTGKTVELNKAGTYNASELATKFVKKSDGFASRYTNFVLAGMDNTGKTGNANVTGAVHRGADFMEPQDGKPILLYTSNLDNNHNFMLKSNPGVIKWDMSEENTAKAYVVELKNLEEQVVFTTEVTDNSAVLDLTDVELKDPAYLLSVRGKDSEDLVSKDALIKIIEDEDDVQEAEKELSGLKSELDLTQAVDNLVLARYYEEKEMYLNAVGCYEKALEIAPGVDSYQNAYTQFLQRINVSKASEEAGE